MMILGFLTSGGVQGGRKKGGRDEGENLGIPESLWLFKVCFSDKVSRGIRRVDL